MGHAAGSFCAATAGGVTTLLPGNLCGVAGHEEGVRLSIHPALAEAVAAWSAVGLWGTAFDTQWRVVAMTTEQAAVSSDSLINGAFHFGPGGVDLDSPTDGPAEQSREFVRRLDHWMLWADMLATV